MCQEGLMVLDVIHGDNLLSPQSLAFLLQAEQGP